MTLVARPVCQNPRMDDATRTADEARLEAELRKEANEDGASIADGPIAAGAISDRPIDDSTSDDVVVPPKLMVPWVAIFLAIANVAVFGWELSAGADAMKPTAQWMMDHGGNFGPLTLDGQQWRLFTSMFLHYGILHIVMNLIGLLDGGRHVERMYGHAGFIALYVISGLAGSLASSVRGEAVSAGASGAVFGIFGAFGAFLLLHRDRLDGEQVKHQARGLMIFLAYNVYFGIMAKGIDLLAHVGGLVAGFLVGLALEIGTDEKHTTLRRALLVGVLGVALVLGSALAVPKPGNALMAFSATEEKVLARWNELVKDAQAGKLEDAKFADIIDTELLPPWRAAHDAYRKDASGPMVSDMLEYLEARQEGWEIIVKGLRANDSEIATQGMARFSEADAVIARMKMKNALEK